MSMAAVDLTPEVVCSCGCGRIHTREAFQSLPLVTSQSNPDGRLIYKEDEFEFRRCPCSSTVCAKL